jgi:DNA-3-methyladenine glycosylase II
LREGASDAAMTHPFPYGARELQHLARADADFAVLIDQCERDGFRPARPVEEDAFQCLVRCINDQLISLKAAASIWGRLVARFGDPISAPALAAADPEQIRACGTTRKKAEYMHDMACMVTQGSLDLEALRHEPDEVVLSTLMGLRGIGRWTAEMLLIHCYERPDVISYGDAAIRRGLCTLKHVDPDDLTRPLFDQLTEPFHPYATTASIYLWWLSKQ